MLLDNQAVTKKVFHVFLFLEFLQILFFAFYKFNFVNEYIDPNSGGSSNTDISSSSSTNTTSGGYEMNEGSQNQVIPGETMTPTNIMVAPKKSSSVLFYQEGDAGAKNLFRFDTQIKWANFDLLVLETQDFTYFILLYSIMICLFLGLVGIIYLGANRIFKVALADEIKDGT